MRLGSCLCVAILAATVGTSASASVLVDFGSSNAAGTIGGNFFNVWNPGNNVDLIESDGVTDSGINLDSTTAAVANNGSSPDFVFTPSGGFPAPFDDDSIASDALNLTPSTVRNVRFLGLDTFTPYGIVIYAAREASETRITTFSLLAEPAGTVLDTGSVTTSGSGIGTGGADYNNDTLLTLTGTTNGDGTLILEYEATTGSFGYLNALQISVVPEPASLAVLGLGGVMLCGRRFRRD